MGNYIYDKPKQNNGGINYFETNHSGVGLYNRRQRQREGSSIDLAKFMKLNNIIVKKGKKRSCEIKKPIWDKF